MRVASGEGSHQTPSAIQEVFRSSWLAMKLACSTANIVASLIQQVPMMHFDEVV
jgi:hypothetical protein